MNDELELHCLGHEVNRFIVRLIALFFFILALMAAGIVFADPGLKVEWPGEAGARNWLFLSKKPCAAKAVLAHIKEQYQARFQAARLSYNGKEYDSCWTVANGAVHSIDETGDLLLPPILFEEFKKDGV